MNTAMSPSLYKKHLSRITSYLKKKAITVKLNSNEFTYSSEDDHISCASKSQGSYEYICGLLHEVGHSRQLNSHFHGMKKSINRNRAIILEQEFSAWYNGWEIATELKINNKQLWSVYQKEWLKYWNHYIDLATTPKTSSAFISDRVGAYPAIESATPISSFNRLPR
jgi:hypothetical protein